MRRMYFILTAVALVISSVSISIMYLESRSEDEEMNTVMQSLSSLQIDPVSKVDEIVIPEIRTKYDSERNRTVSINGKTKMSDGELALIGDVCNDSEPESFREEGGAGKRNSLNMRDEVSLAIKDVISSVIAPLYMQLRADSDNAIRSVSNEIESLRVIVGDIDRRHHSYVENSERYGIARLTCLLGFASAISTLLIAWRKDAREVKALQLQIAESHTGSPGPDPHGRKRR